MHHYPSIYIFIQGPGDECGGPWGAYGGCGTNLRCQITRAAFPRSHSSGICVENTRTSKFIYF